MIKVVLSNKIKLELPNIYSINERAKTYMLNPTSNF